MKYTFNFKWWDRWTTPPYPNETTIIVKAKSIKEAEQKAKDVSEINLTLNRYEIKLEKIEVS